MSLVVSADIPHLALRQQCRERQAGVARSSQRANSDAVSGGAGATVKAELALDISCKIRIEAADFHK